MELAVTAVLSGHGCHTAAAAAAAASPASPVADPPTKFLDAAAIDDEDLFLGGDDDNDDGDYDDDFDDDYFNSTYRPLSNLPTPPPSSRTSSIVHSPQVDQGEALESSLLGPAVHLVNMLPPAASLATPSVPLVQAMLTRAHLPLDTVALAVCILDSLDSRFARTWRLACPLGGGGGGGGNGGSPLSGTTSTTTTATHSSTAAPSAPHHHHHGKRHTLPSPLSPLASFPALPPTVDRLLHIDAVFPEVIILAALVIAAKFTEDGHVSQQPAQAYCTAWGANGSGGGGGGGDNSSSNAIVSLWTGAQLAATERCIMQNLGYRILPLLDAGLLADAQADMRRAGAQALRTQKLRAAAANAAVAEAAAAAAAEQAVMTPPEEAVVAVTSAPPAGLGLQLQLTPPTDAADTAEGCTLLEKVQRRHHVSSRSECLGRFAGQDL